jgi:hypothetical protein
MRTRILLVEDEPTISEPLAESLGRDGFEAEVAPTLAGAREDFRREAPDFVLLDVMLPDGTAEISLGRSARSHDDDQGDVNDDDQGENDVNDDDQGDVNDDDQGENDVNDDDQGEDVDDDQGDVNDDDQGENEDNGDQGENEDDQARTRATTIRARTPAPAARTRVRAARTVVRAAEASFPNKPLGGGRTRGCGRHFVHRPGP